jgi:hypothetical protein
LLYKIALVSGLNKIWSSLASTSKMAAAKIKPFVESFRTSSIAERYLKWEIFLRQSSHFTFSRKSMRKASTNGL